MKPAADALIVDTSELNIDEVVQLLSRTVQPD